MKIHFNFYSSFVSLVIKYAMDENKIIDFDSCRKFTSGYRSDLFDIFVERSVCVACYFQSWVNAGIFVTIFDEVKRLELIITTLILKRSLYFSY